MTPDQTISNLAENASMKQRLKTGHFPMSRYYEVFDNAVLIASTIRGFCTIQHVVATYEQTKERLSNFYAKNFSARWNTHSSLDYIFMNSFLKFLNNCELQVVFAFVSLYSPINSFKLFCHFSTYN